MNFPDMLPAAPVDARFERDVLAGLRAPEKSIPCQWFYDTRWSELFEAITRLPEYYLTRTEIALLEAHAGDMAAHIGANAAVVEFGSGSSRKTPLLLEALDAPRLYVPVDIAAEFLVESVRQLLTRMPWLRCRPLAADLNGEQAWRDIVRVLPAGGPRVGLFLGSSIGNFTPAQARTLLQRFARALGPAAWLIIGVDSTRNPALLLPAYDDAQGVTAQFNLNVLRRINRELAGDFDLSRFAHAVRFDASRDRLEMHLISRDAQTVHVAGRGITFAAGESIHTENCHKYACERFEALAGATGWRRVARWGAEAGFGLYLLRQG